MGCTHPLRLHQNERVEGDALHAGLFQVWMDLSQSTAQTHPNRGDPQRPAWPVSPVGHPPAAEAPRQRGLPAPPAAAVTVSCPRWSGQLLRHLHQGGLSSVAG